MEKTRNQRNKSKGNGDGTIYFNKSKGVYVGQYMINYQRKTIYQKKKETLTDFKKRFNKILNEINEGTHIEKSKETIITIAEQYIENKHNDGTTTDRSYRRDLETLEELKKTCADFCNIPIQKVTIQHIENAKINIRQYANSVIDKIWSLLNKAFNIACSPSRKILTYNLMQDENLKKPISMKRTEKVMSLTKEELNKLNSVLDNEERKHKYRNIAKMQLISGMRIGEVLARSIDDYNIESKEFHIYNTVTQDGNYKIILGEHTKTYNKRKQKDEGERYLPLDNYLFGGLIDIIKEQSNVKVKNIHNLLFWDYENNTFITPSEVNSWLKRINKKYKISKKDLSTHKLRHTALTYWKELGLQLSTIQHLAGHVEGSKITEEVYIDISKEAVVNDIKNRVS